MTKNQKKLNKLFLIFFLFVLCFIVIVISMHYSGALEMPPQSWTEIAHDLWLYILYSLLGVFLIFLYTFEDDT